MIVVVIMVNIVVVAAVPVDRADERVGGRRMQCEQEGNGRTGWIIFGLSRLARTPVCRVTIISYETRVSSNNNPKEKMVRIYCLVCHSNHS